MALAVIAIRIDLSGAPGLRVLQTAGRALRQQLRHRDPVARVADATFATVLTLFPDGTPAEAVERRLATALRDALAPTGAGVRSAHVVVASGDGREADELVAEALGRLGGG
jgi:GGDEF domain-containing protein